MHPALRQTGREYTQEWLIIKIKGRRANDKWRVKRGEWRMIGDVIKQKGRI
jgi:hypothetical protein